MGRRPEAELLAAGVQPWQHLPFWLPADVAATAWDVDNHPGAGARAAQPTGARHGGRHLGLAAAATSPCPRRRDLPGLPPELEARLLAAQRPG